MACALLAGAIAIGSCGEEGEQRSAETQAATADERGQPGKRDVGGDELERPPSQRQSESPAERAARARVEGVYELLAVDDGEAAGVDTGAFCAALSKRARRRTIAYVEATVADGVGRDCAESIGRLLARAEQRKAFRRIAAAKVIGVNAEGRRATATVRFGKGPASSIALVKEGGEWKLGEPVGVEGKG